MRRERVPVQQGLRNLWGSVLRLWPAASVIPAVVLLAILGRAAADYARGLTPVLVIVDGRARQVRTRCSTVGEVLADLSIDVGASDRLSAPVTTALEPRMRIEVQHARPVHLAVDGVTRVVRTLGVSADEILAEADIALRPGDRLRIDGELQPKPSEPQSGAIHVRAASLSGLSTEAKAAALVPVSRVEVVRAAKVHVLDRDTAQVLHSTLGSVGEALSEANVLLYEGDRVVPRLDAPLANGLEVRILRAKPVDVYVDGRVLRTRTQSERVGDVLAELGLSLVGQDVCDPPLDATVADGAKLRVTRVTERTEVEQEELPFETVWVPDETLELDERHLDDPGAIGVRRRRYKVVYHDQTLVERVLEEDWLAQAPRSRQIAYGTKVVVRTLDTPDGEIEYWRRIRVFRTAYTAATCGKTRSHPEYGITRLGWVMRHGIIATDPRVIRLRTRLYVPGYGPGIAGDTGGLIIGRHIDLGFEEGGLSWHHEWGDVYLLTPAPPTGEIPYILPDFPMGVYR